MLWHEHWDEQPRMPAGNHDHIFARIGDRLYTAGGKTFFGWPASEWVNLDHVWSYHIPSGTWRVEPPMLEPGKAYSGIAALDDELWLLGRSFPRWWQDASDGDRRDLRSPHAALSPRPAVTAQSRPSGGPHRQWPVVLRGWCRRPRPDGRGPEHRSWGDELAG